MDIDEEKINIEIGQPDKFYAKITKNGPRALTVTIPKEIILANGWKAGRRVVVWIKKLKE